MRSKVISGVNDVANLVHYLVAEVDDWYPETVHSGTHKKMPWKCEKGHAWEASLSQIGTGLIPSPFFIPNEALFLKNL